MLFTDKLYIESKLILCGKIDLKEELKELKLYLKNNFSVELINADIYRQPVFTHMSPMLRLVFDKEKGYGELPILMEERIKKIGAVFNKIIVNTNISEYEDFVGIKLTVDYFDYNYYKFQESYQLVSTYLRQVLVDIHSIYRFHDTLFLIYQTKELADFNKKSNLSNEVILKAKELVQCNGYDGVYLLKINVVIVDKPTIDIAGGFRNYLR